MSDFMSMQEIFSLQIAECDRLVGVKFLTVGIYLLEGFVQSIELTVVHFVDRAEGNLHAAAGARDMVQSVMEIFSKRTLNTRSKGILIDGLLFIDDGGVGFFLLIFAPLSIVLTHLPFFFL